MPIAYDPTQDALFRPQTRDPLSMRDWPPDAVAAEFARLAYFRFEEPGDARAQIEHAVGEIGYERCGWFMDSRATPDRLRLDAQGFAAMRGDHAIVSFRGTQADSFRDIVSDARFLMVEWEGKGRVHRGFWAALQSILSDVRRWIATSGARTLTITGHSLGAAMATLLAGLYENAELVTFGSPRVGDATFAASFAGRTVRRYVDCTDIVTMVPPPPAYAHLDGLLYIDHLGKVHDAQHAVPSIIEDQLAAETAYLSAIWHPQNVHLRNLADHAPINYVSAVLGVREGP